MTDEEVVARALTDPDNPPRTREQLARMKRLPRAVSMRRIMLRMTQEEFADTFQIPIGTLRDWEQGRTEPDQAAKAYLKVIAADPYFVRLALAHRPGDPSLIAFEEFRPNAPANLSRNGSGQSHDLPLRLLRPRRFDRRRIVSGIGNGMAQAFRGHGADVHVWGTRAKASDYKAEDGSDLTGLTYAKVDVSDFAAIEAHQPPFKTLDVLILCQGKVLYKRAEFKAQGFRDVVDVNLNSLMACADKFYPMLSAAKGSLIIVSSTAAYHASIGNPAYNASKIGAVGLTRTLGAAWAGDGIRVNGIAPGFVATKMTQVTTGNPETAQGRGFANPGQAARHAGGYGQRGAVSGLATGGLCRWSDDPGRRRLGPVRPSAMLAVSEAEKPLK